MERNRILYFIIGVILTGLGYAMRVMQVENYYRGSAIIIAMGLYFIFAVMFKKASAFFLTAIDILICGGLHIVRFANIPWYNIIYDSQVGELILGGPFKWQVLLYVLCGTVLGLFFEKIVSQYNRIGLGD